MEVQLIGRTPDIVRVSELSYYESLLKLLENEKSIERVNVGELPGYVQLKVIFSKNGNENCYRAMKNLIPEAKKLSSENNLEVEFVPLEWYDEGRLQIGPALYVGKIHCTFLPPENGEMWIFRPKDHETLLAKYGLPEKVTKM